MSDTFKILSIDGGGYRGVYAAHILKRIEEEFGTNWNEQIDMFAGTSTGSIIAAGLALNVTANDILDFYREHGDRIFSRRAHGCLASIYDTKYLAKTLGTVFGDTKLGDITVPLIIPATDIGNGGVHVFKSAYDAEFKRDLRVCVRDAVLASCAAPLYFDPKQVNEYLLADGGLWANNPSLVAVIDARRRLNQDFKNIRVLSLGTGSSRWFYSQRPPGSGWTSKWGFMGRWRHKKFILMLLNLQAQSATNMLGLVLGRQQITRLDFDSDDILPLDDPGGFSDLISRADRTFSHNASAISAFLSTQKES